MILATDVHYRNDHATIAGVLFTHWQAAEPDAVIISQRTQIAAYIPGQFYRRELPCLLQLLDELPTPPTIMIIDGFVYLDAGNKPGLGKYLYDALQGNTPIIGVAKSAFKEPPAQSALWRGASKNPLYITAAGIALQQAKAHIAEMHGEFRIPTLLKRADQACRRGIIKRKETL